MVGVSCVPARSVSLGNPVSSLRFGDSGYSLVLRLTVLADDDSMKGVQNTARCSMCLPVPPDS